MNAPIEHSHSGGHHDGHSDGGAGHGSVKSYLIGFGLSVVLTAVPFALIMGHVLPAATAIPLIMVIGLIQILVHLVFFLHMNTSSAQIWNNAAFAFTLIIVGILIAGSLWIMYHLNMNMMPGMMPMD